ncbi:MAG: hypothetical protein AAGD25_20355 [Cyanobacteria bacterium P01_F01_bin.150]
MSNKLINIVRIKNKNNVGRMHTIFSIFKIILNYKPGKIEQVSREENPSMDEIKGIFDYIWSQRQKPQWSEVKRLSMDEVSMRKGHQNFVGLVRDIGQKITRSRAITLPR